jgi:hypothetical protein
VSTRVAWGLLRGGLIYPTIIIIIIITTTTSSSFGSKGYKWQAEVYGK